VPDPVAAIRCCQDASLKTSALMPAEVSFEPSKLPLGPSGLIGSKNTKQNKALQSLKRQSVGRFSFARINSCTYRLDHPVKLAAGALMEVGWPGGQGSDGLHEWAIGQASRCRSMR
jgi:hypothetical protein